MLAITLEPIPTTPRNARRAAGAWLHANGATREQIESAVLIVSELVTNAVVHADTPVTLRLDRDGSRFRVDVTDRGATFGLLGGSASPNGGRGLLIVDRLSESWGFEMTRAGKRVWAFVPAGSDE